MNTFVALIVALLFLSSRGAFAWGDQGHKAIWAAAQSQLTAKAKKKVTQIINGDKVAMTAVWLDRARDAKNKHSGPLVHDAEADSFSAAFPDHPNWHFVNLPLSASAYETPGFTNANDVVERIEFCISVLEGKDTTLSKRIALRALVHLVGDIHQPMHCSAGYYDVSNLDQPRLVTDPTEALQFQKFNDRGANQLFFGPGPVDELHGYWDFELPKQITGGSASYIDLKEILLDRIASDSCDETGDYHHWPGEWAVESVAIAKNAYAPLQFQHCTLDHTSQKIERIAIVMPPDYGGTFGTTAEIQMSKAACRLAALLNKIFH